MNLSVLEGVAFALRDCVEAVRACCLSISRATVCGGGAKSGLWKRILANVLNVEVLSPETEQGPAYGAALLAMVGAGRFKSVEEAAKALVKLQGRIFPESNFADKYERKYRTFRKFYPALKGIYG